MCVWTSIRPGIAVYRRKSITSAPAGIFEGSVVMSAMRSPRTITIASVQTLPFPSTSLPKRRALAGGSAARLIAMLENTEIARHKHVKIRRIVKSPRMKFRKSSIKRRGELLISRGEHIGDGSDIAFGGVCLNWMAVRHGRKVHQKRCAALGAVEALDMAAVLLHNSVADAETETGPFAHRLGGEERIENLLGRFNSRTGIRKLDEDSFRVVVGANHKFASAHFFDGIHGIAHQIEEDLQNLIGISAHCRQFRIGYRFDAHLLSAQVEVTEMEGIVDHMIDVEIGFFRWNPAREAQQACDERFDPAR